MIVPALALLQTAAVPAVWHPTILAWMAAYLAAVAAIGWWASQRTRTAADFFVAGRGLGLVTMTIAAMSATLSGFAFIGGPGLVYRIGWSALFIVLPLSVTASQGAWVLGTRLRLLAELRPMYTIPDAIGARYRSRAAQALAGVAIVVAVVGYVATNLLALGLVLDAVLGIGLRPAIWLGAIVVVAYSVGGGILAGAYTDLLQGTLMAVASVAVFVLVLRVGGGMTAISETLLAGDAASLSPFGKAGALAALSFFFVFGVGALGQPHVIHKYYMLRDPQQLRWHPLLLAGSMTMTLLLFVAVGLGAHAMVLRGAMPPLANPDHATPLFLLRFAPTGMTGLVFAGVAAAIMSSVNAFLNVGSAAVTRDIPVWWGAGAPSLRVSRWATAVLALLATLLATYSGVAVAFLGIFGWGLFASTLVPALAIGLNWAGATRQGAIASIATGLVLTLGLESAVYLKRLTLPGGVPPTALSLLASLLVFLLVSYLTRRSAADQIDPDVRRVLEA